MAFNLFNLFRSISFQPAYEQERVEKLTNDQNLEEQPKRPLYANELPIGSEGYDYPSFVYKYGCKTVDLKQLEWELQSFKLTREAAEFIDYVVRFNPIVSKIYIDHVTMADTLLSIEGEIEGFSEDQFNKLVNNFKESLPAFYEDCNAIQDVTHLIFTYLVRYGGWVSQKWYNETGALSGLVVAPPYTIEWKQGLTKWYPVQKTRNGEFPVAMDGFLYKPLFPQITAEGKFFIPPLLAGIAKVPLFDRLYESMNKTAQVFGFSKMLKPMLDADAFAKLNELRDIQISSRKEDEGKTLWEMVGSLIDKTAQVIQNVFKVGALPLLPGIKVEEGTAYDLPKNLAEFRNIIVGDMITGCLSYQSLVGNASTQNQTTLANVQKNAQKNIISSIQSAAASIVKHDFVGWAAGQGYLVQKCSVFFAPPIFDDDKQTEEARAVRLNNDILEKNQEVINNDSKNSV